MKSLGSILLLCLLIAGCCMTDKLIVFEKNLLSDNEMKRMLGGYRMTEKIKDLFWDDMAFTLDRTGALYNFSADAKNQDGDYGEFTCHFLLSKIPNSKSNLLLFSSPELSRKGNDNPMKNFFAIWKVDGRKLFVWLVDDSTAPVLEGRVAMKGDFFDAEEMKDFLENFADAYVLANPPAYTFEKKR